jgi:hypothetical protein
MRQASFWRVARGLPTAEDCAVVASCPGIDPQRSMMVRAATTSFGTQAAVCFGRKLGGVAHGTHLGWFGTPRTIRAVLRVKGEDALGSSAANANCPGASKGKHGDDFVRRISRIDLPTAKVGGTPPCPPDDGYALGIRLGSSRGKSSLAGSGSSRQFERIPGRLEPFFHPCGPRLSLGTPRTAKNVANYG